MRHTLFSRLRRLLEATLACLVMATAPFAEGQSSDTGRGEDRGADEQNTNDKGRKFWAFQPICRSTPRRQQKSSWPVSDIDRWVLDALDEHHIEPNPPATKRELIRRAHFDLIGLPPTPEDVAAFESDESPRAFEHVVDELMARPEYGERWARHWLDVVRYAETNGYERDGEKLNAWRYRDYVIRAFNEDKPYDQFILEQLAGDELENVTDDSLIATGFYRLGVWDDEPDDARMAEFEALDDVLVTTGAAFLGLTIGCARCHEHKFDPIPQEDYYRLLAFIRNIRPYANPKMAQDSATFLPLGDRAAAATRLAAAKERTKPLEEELAKTSDNKEKKRLQDEIAKIELEAAGDLEWALAVRDGETQATHVFTRGNVAAPGAEVEPALLTVLGGRIPNIAAPSQRESTGRRLALARWIASPDHPLTARVMANRVWQHHFGRGIVKSTSDFGHSGVAPTHPELLDWLAAELISGGWSIKHLHKVIMLSNTYQMSSRVSATAGAAIESSAASLNENRVGQRDPQDVDPANDLFWRQNVRRLEAEAIRDSILAASGSLVGTRGGRGFFPYTAGEVLAAGSRPGDGWATSPPQDRARRSIYAFVKRSMVPPFFECFDYSNTAAPLGERPVTTVAPQALMLLNDQFMQEQASALADRIERDAGCEPVQQIERAYTLTMGRRPSSDEIRVASRYIAKQKRSYTALASRLTFAPDVPISLHRAFMNRLQRADFLLGPREGWSYYRGRWGRDYEGITTLDRRCTPFALWEALIGDATVTAEITLQKGIECASILIRCSPDGDVFRGYDLVFDPREQAVELRRHAEEVTTLVRTQCPVRASQPFQVRIETTGPRTRLWVHPVGEPAQEAPILDVTDPDPLAGPGRLGVRPWGAAMSLDHLMVQNALDHSGGIARPESAISPDRQALESFCLVMFNLNEFIYVD